MFLCVLCVRGLCDPMCGVCVVCVCVCDSVLQFICWVPCQELPTPALLLGVRVAVENDPVGCRVGAVGELIHHIVGVGRELGRRHVVDDLDLRR